MQYLPNLQTNPTPIDASSSFFTRFKSPMADTAKHFPGGGGGGPPLSLVSEVREVFRNRRAVTLVCASMFAFVVFLVLSPSSSDPFLTNVFSPSSSEEDSSSYRSRVSSIFSYLFHPNNSTCRPASSPAPNSTVSVPSHFTDGLGGSRKAFPAALSTNRTSDSSPPSWNVSLPGNSNTTQTAVAVELSSVSNQTKVGSFGVNWSNAETPARNFTGSGVVAGWVAQKTGFNHSSGCEKNIDTHPKKSAGNGANDAVDEQNQTMAVQGATNSVPGGPGKKAAADHPLELLRNCDFFDGEWVRDESYPLYEPGSCSLIDEKFNCILNGRPDKDYQKLKWKPKGCNLPRLDGAKMLELLRGKRLAFVGDSLNRNMWESLVCILRGAVKDQNNVYEANGRMIFRGEASYSFIFKDYDLKLDFFVSPFLVREWEARDKDGKIMETLRLDLISMSCDQYKGADIIVFNTGHWWTHDKTSKGKDYYQEGNRVYEELNVLEAFRKALTTWGRWVDANIDPTKTLVFFRGYSDSHFSGGQWNSGGQCDSETDPIKNSTYLREYPPKMEALEKILKEMKTPVVYLNVTKMTDYRKDGHPSIYRKQHLTDSERRSPLRYQDCSHWCLPGVPDLWNEIFYADLLVKLHKEHRQ